MQQIKDYQKFDFSMIQIFCETIEDVDTLAQLLESAFTFSVYANRCKENTIDLICFLKKHYFENQILEFFESQNFIKNSELFDNALLEYCFNKDIIEANFKKVKCDIVSIHDEFAQCVKKHQCKHVYEKKLSYLESEKKHCVEINNYQVKLPINDRELFNWGIELYNQMYVYFDQIKNKSLIFYCFFKNNHLEFAVEISKGKIIQASRKYKKDLTKEESKVLDKWFKQSFT